MSPSTGLPISPWRTRERACPHPPVFPYPHGVPGRVHVHMHRFISGPPDCDPVATLRLCVSLPFFSPSMPVRAFSFVQTGRIRYDASVKNTVLAQFVRGTEIMNHQLPRRELLKRCAVLAAGAYGAAASGTKPAGAAESQAAERWPLPNILWLDAEDMCPELGCYGMPLVHTPNLDRLAAEGVRFERAYATCPVCSPSRSAMLTGMYQTTIGAHHHRSNRDTPLPDGVRFLTDYLREAGYFTVNGNAERPGRPGKQDFNFKVDHPYDGTDWGGRKPGQPFFAQLHFSEAHRTFHADPDHPVDPDAAELPPYYPDDPLARLDWALYLETIQHLDKKVGAVLDRLEAEGLADNTVVFFTSDHGRAMVRGKQWLYEGGIRVPMIVRWPGRIKPGTVRRDLVSLLDLAPTWLRIAGLEPPAHLQGHDLFDTEFPPREWFVSARDRCDGTDDRIRCVVTPRYKYIRNFHPQVPYTQFNEYKTRQYPVLTLLGVLHERGELTPEQARFMAPYRPPEELYDLKQDPHEVHNLADDPAHTATLERLRAQLDEWICESGDRGQIPERPEEAFAEDQVDVEQWAEFVGELGFDPREEAGRYLDWWRERMHEMKPPAARK